MAGTSTRRALAGRVWRAMFDVLMKSAPLRTVALARRGLTPNDSRALFSLDLGQGRTMRSLADDWRCDPSNATWIVDRLETLGLAERRALPDDRRVKLVALTSEGARTRAALMRDFYRPPAELAALDLGDLEALDRILAKIVSAAPVHHPPRESRRSTAPPRRARINRRER